MTPQSIPFTNSHSVVSLIREKRSPLPLTLTAKPSNVAIDLARSALVVVDMQNDFCHSDGWFATSGTNIAYARDIIGDVAALISSAREREVPVIHLHWGVRGDTLELSHSQLMFGTRFGKRKGYGDKAAAGHRILVSDEWGAEAIDELKPAVEDIVVHKSRFSGFWHTELDAILRRLDVSTLLFAGINTERCVMATLQDASFLGYNVVLMEDAVATPSPEASKQAALTLIRQLYGFTAVGCSLVD
ncbi:cysteine hydrolase family protein [Halomonas sp. HAL1]|uniref:cysteine hydrolase family protein n=1 Tax=Halomonas sp. HAL1 TaxID=550984 RepID=UPI00022D34A5|nr:cysteine hydrolase family protein [Halomonas sp. HAL1]EHA16796.1 isochorismatase [Halomonas sp. HAL1]WKV92780.1 cysteine hydrolase family protein [Halomonas sp. HAL1]